MTPTTIITRSALVFHGLDPGPEVAAVELDVAGERHIRTWEDVMRARRERQRHRLAEKRRHPCLRAWRLYVAHFGNGLFGGYQAMIDRIGDSHWIDRDRKWLQPTLMQKFPLCLLNDWEQWKEEFAKTYRRRKQCRHPVGVALVWWDGGDELANPNLPAEA